MQLIALAVVLGIVVALAIWSYVNARDVRYEIRKMWIHLEHLHKRESENKLGARDERSEDDWLKEQDS